ncbi:MAG: DUF4416 family protein [Planctomycetota bacterium]
MWQIANPKPAKLLVGILACDEQVLHEAVKVIEKQFGAIDLASQTWLFDSTGYYAEQTGPNIIKQFVSIEQLVDPGKLAPIKLKTNRLEQQLARKTGTPYPRPVNIDPGLIEPSKLILASTKNYSHRIYIAKGIYAEVTLCYKKGCWQSLEYTYPDYAADTYHDFLTQVRTKLVEQLRTI